MGFHHSRRAVKTMTPMAMINSRATTEGTRISRVPKSGSTESVSATCSFGAMPIVSSRPRSQPAASHQHVQVGSLDVLEDVLCHRGACETAQAVASF